MINKNTAPDPNSPFQGGPLDEHQVVTTKLVLDGMNPAEIESALNGLQAAIEEKRKLGQLKEALEAAGNLLAPLMKPIKPI